MTGGDTETPRTTEERTLEVKRAHKTLTNWNQGEQFFKQEKLCLACLLTLANLSNQMLAGLHHFQIGSGASVL